MCVCVYVCMCVCVYVCMCVCAAKSNFFSDFFFAPVYTHTHTHTHIQTRTHTYTHMYTYIYTLRSRRWRRWTGPPARLNLLSALPALRFPADERTRGASICQHNRIRSTCKDCGGTSICLHNLHNRHSQTQWNGARTLTDTRSLYRLRGVLRVCAYRARDCASWGWYVFVRVHACERECAHLDGCSGVRGVVGVVEGALCSERLPWLAGVAAGTDVHNVTGRSDVVRVSSAMGAVSVWGGPGWMGAVRPLARAHSTWCPGDRAFLLAILCALKDRDWRRTITIHAWRTGARDSVAICPPGRRFVAFWRAKPNPEILKERINEAKENKILLAE